MNWKTRKFLCKLYKITDPMYQTCFLLYDTEKKKDMWCPRLFNKDCMKCMEISEKLRNERKN